MNSLVDFLHLEMENLDTQIKGDASPDDETQDMQSISTTTESLNRVYEVPINLKNAGIGSWNDGSKIEMVKLRGNFWKTFGHSIKGKNYLWVEEALLLYERGLIVVEDSTQKRIPFAIFYEAVMKAVGSPCYATYVKLRAFDFIAVRNSDDICSFSSDLDITARARAFPEKSMLDVCVSFKIYLHTTEWSKKLMGGADPVGFVVVITGEYLPSARLIWKLIEEGRGIPIIFAIVTCTGFVLLEELTNAFTSLNWENSLKKEFVFENPLSIVDEHARCTKSRKRKLQPAIDVVAENVEDVVGTE